MLTYLSGCLFVSLLPTIVAFWQGRGAWKLAAFIMSLVSFLVFVSWTMIAGNFDGQSLLAWGPFLASWGLSWLFAWLAIQERKKDGPLDPREWRRLGDVDRPEM
jgi:hypothetical protein